MVVNFIFSKTKYFALFLIFTMLFSLSLQNCKDTENPSAKVCKKVNLTNEEKEDYKNEKTGNTADSCCYLTGEGEDLHIGCIPAVKNEVEDFIKQIEDEGAKNVKVDCSGKFLSLASGVLILLLSA